MIEEMKERVKILSENIEKRIEEGKEAIKLAQRLGLDVTEQELKLLDQEKKLAEIKKVFAE